MWWFRRSGPDPTLHTDYNVALVGPWPDQHRLEIPSRSNEVVKCAQVDQDFFVASGIVSVNGEVELRKTCKIVAGNIVQIEDQEIHVVAVGS